MGGSNVAALAQPDCTCMRPLIEKLRDAYDGVSLVLVVLSGSLKRRKHLTAWTEAHR